jgi:hypothetical protein
LILDGDGSFMMLETLSLGPQRLPDRREAMKAQRTLRHPVMTTKDRRFENLLHRAAELLNRRNSDFGPRPNAKKRNAAA